jgi:hypothetical protein
MTLAGLAVCRNVKRWRDAKMALRWTAAGMLEAALPKHQEPRTTGVEQTAEAAEP